MIKNFEEEVAGVVGTVEERQRKRVIRRMLELPTFSSLGASWEKIRWRDGGLLVDIGF